MSRRYFLGEDGEAAYTRLERSLRLGPDSGRASVASDSVDVRYEVRRRVGEILRVEVVRPSGDVVRRIHEVVEVAGSPVLVWIEAPAGMKADSEPWRRAYTALNMGRDVLADKGKLSLVLAGPVPLDEQVKQRAPDLVSVMRPMLVLGTRLDPVEEAVGPSDDGAGDRHRDARIHVIADVLARVVPDLEEARTIARRAEFPAELLPQSKTAEGFWSDVVEQATRGRIRLEALVAEAMRRFPYNSELAECKKRIERITHVQLDDLCVRLRRVAATKHRNHVFARMPLATPKPLGLVWEAVVPLDFEEHEVFAGHDDGDGRLGLRSRGSKVELEMLVERIDPARDIDDTPHGLVASPRRLLAILGDPGSGKSTLCRWLAATIAEREAGRAPILVEAVDWMGREGSTSLLDVMARAADSGVLGTISVATLKGLCDEGRIVLLVDGYDEPMRAHARTRMRGDLDAFSAEYPKVSIVVTSRVEGYLEAGLLPPWQTLVIAPFDEGKLEEFVRRWYAMVEPNDREARARGRAELVAALAAEPRAREMARNPLLATLIAEVHQHQKAPLPGRRSVLYGLVVELLLVTRPTERGHLFEEIDKDEQRTRLEHFALWLQEQRGTEDGADIVFGRDDFVREVAAADVGHEAISRRQAQQWLEWLVQEAGLMREGRSGRYSFLHLSLMEYLAAQGILARFAGDLEGLRHFLVKVSYERHWRETILLLFGSQADNRPIVSLAPEVVLGGSGGTFEGRHAVQLLFGLLIEDLDISARGRANILSHGIMLESPDFVFRELERVISYSRHHGQETQDWLLERIARANNWEAVRVAAACPPRLWPERVLASRADLVEVAPMFLDTAPRDYGEWARSTLSQDVLMRWAADSPSQGVFSMALARLAKPGILARMWVAAVLSRTDPDARVSGSSRVDNVVAIRWNMSREYLDKNVMPVCLCTRLDQMRRRGVLWDDLAHVHTIEALELWKSAIERVTEGSLESEDRERLSLLYGSPLAGFFARREAVLAPDFPAHMCKVLGLVFSGEPWSWEETQPLAAVGPSEVGEEDPYFVATLVEVHAALLTTQGSIGPFHRIRHRLDNLFIHDFFDGIVDFALERGTEHDCLPLLLALGFSQYQTTWSWPRGRHWKQWFSSPPPEDWLAAFFWHLCWAVGEVDRYTEHYAAAQACLNRADWPELAAELGAYTIRPMTVEEWQRKDDSPPPEAPTPEG